LSVLKCFLFTVAVLSAALPAHSQELKVAAASDLSAVMDRLAPAFEKQAGIQVAVSLGSSGNFFSQIQNGAPFDVFMSADRSYPEKLEQSGRVEPRTLTSYALGKLVIWIPKGSPVALTFNAEHVLTGDLKALTSSQVRKIAVANPAHAPYGRAAVAALKSYGIYDEIQSKLALGENISQAAQFVQSGNADVGLIALSLALSEAMQRSGTYLLIPQDKYEPLEQAAAVLSGSKQKEAARRFVEFLKSPAARRIFRESGFEVPQP